MANTCCEKLWLISVASILRLVCELIDDRSDGSVGMIGGSYSGIAQWQLAVLNNPHLKAIFPVVSGSDSYLDRFYSPGGAMKLGNRLLWMSLNLRAPGYNPPEFERFVLHLPLRTSDRVATGQTLDIDADDHERRAGEGDGHVEGRPQTGTSAGSG